MQSILRKSAIWLILTLDLGCLPKIYAQTVLTLPATGTDGAAVDFELRLDGSLFETGAGTSTLTDADLQQGSRFLWYPTLQALRVGGGSGTETVSGIGQYSMAFGNGSIASGTSSTAFGNASVASGTCSVAIGLSTASGNYSTAMGEATASGIFATALGHSYAFGNESTSMGYGASATGTQSTAMGVFDTASGIASVAMGGSTIASGDLSVAMGGATSASAYSELALGKFNKGLSSTGGTPSATTWVATDPLIEAGNGTSSSAKSDAFVLYKNGNADIQGTLTTGGVITAAPGGDIPMFTGY